MVDNIQKSDVEGNTKPEFVQFGHHCKHINSEMEASDNMGGKGEHASSQHVSSPSKSGLEEHKN